MKGMRIAFVAYHGSVHTRRWAAFCAQAGHDVHVVTCGGGAVAADGYEVRDLGTPRMGKVGYLLKMAAARRELRRIDPDLVHAHWVTSYGLLALASGRSPLVVTAHGDDVLIAPRNPLFKVIVARVLRAAELVTVPSEQMRDAVEALAGRDLEIAVVQYGVDTERLRSIAADVRVRQTPGLALGIVSARPLLRLYRFDCLLEGLALLHARGLEWRCDLYGDGPEREQLVTRARELGLDGKVAFHGQCPAEEVEEALAGADVYVSMAESDGASIALLEALALGPIPVLSDIPANRAWVQDGVNGTLTDIAPEQIADAIVRAVALDAGTVRVINQSLVAERGDRVRNLSWLDRRLRDLLMSQRPSTESAA
jgi:L-malate glycosyltransferase